VSQRRWRSARVASFALVGQLALSACTTNLTYRLPTLAGDTGACRGVGLDGYQLAGSPTDARVAWLVLVGRGVRRDVVWSAGYHAEFTPRLVIVDGSGKTVMKEGDAVKGGCVTGAGGMLGPEPLLIQP
jgi:hypothetical protein